MEFDIRNLPVEFQQMYYANCDERRMYNQPLYTIEEYWKIWLEFKNNNDLKR